MVLRINRQARIENPRDYAASIIDELGDLLEAGGEARRDPSRKNFYEVDNGHHTFYLHVSPVSGNIVLLAKWLRRPQDAGVVTAPQAASSGHPPSVDGIDERFNPSCE